jgi:hypothetical protein
MNEERTGNPNTVPCDDWQVNWSRKTWSDTGRCKKQAEWARCGVSDTRNKSRGCREGKNEEGEEGEAKELGGRMMIGRGRAGNTSDGFSHGIPAKLAYICQLLDGIYKQKRRNAPETQIPTRGDANRSQQIGSNPSRKNRRKVGERGPKADAEGQRSLRGVSKEGEQTNRERTSG